MNDFLNFRKMLTPVIIRILFWIGIVAVVLTALVAMKDSFFRGLIMLLLGPVMVRVWCELLIVIFSINDTLTDIRNSLRKPAE